MNVDVVKTHAVVNIMDFVPSEQCSITASTEPIQNKLQSSFRANTTLSRMSKILKFLILPFLDPGSPVNLVKPFKTISGSFGVLLNLFCMWGPTHGP